MGSQNIQRQIYDYRLIFHQDDKMLNVSSDMDFNISGEIKLPVSKNAVSKTNISLGEANSISADVDLCDEESTSQVSYAYDTNQGGHMIGLSYMQALSRSTSLGGSGNYLAGKGKLKLSLGGIYDEGENMFGAQLWGPNVSQKHLLIVSFYLSFCLLYSSIFFFFILHFPFAYGISLSSD